MFSRKPVEGLHVEVQCDHVVCGAVVAVLESPWRMTCSNGYGNCSGNEIELTWTKLKEKISTTGYDRGSRLSPSHFKG